ncbi:MAG: FAD/NAD(P)-binding protein, partial [Actinomycetota bacterium]|nr:FAD/NAD(P)-binding protein [Actinomycetota bacterium]
MPRPLRVAVVGSGPSGLYAADALAYQESLPVEVDVIDRLPVPFGLVRYGVAPDHLSIRSVRDTLDKVLDRPGVRFVGNVRVGTDITVTDLHGCFDAVVWTYGASGDRRLGIPGEDLAGSVAATDFVAWYCGHPDADRTLFEDLVPRASGVVVVGIGNVAVDVTRVLAKTVAELDHTDMPQHVLDALGRSQVTDIHVLGRRGPAQATFTTKELRELGELAEADILVDPADLVLDPASQSVVDSDKAVARNLEVMRGWADRAPQGRPRRPHQTVFAPPVERRATEGGPAVVVARTRLALDGG